MRNFLVCRDGDGSEEQNKTRAIAHGYMVADVRECEYEYARCMNVQRV